PPHALTSPRRRAPHWPCPIPLHDALPLFGVRDRSVVAHHHLRPDDRLPRPASPGARAVSIVPELVWLALEDVEQLLVDVAAAIITDVDDDSLLLPEAVDLVLEPLERRLVHRLDMHVRNLPVGRLVDGVAIVRHPFLVFAV